MSSGPLYRPVLGPITSQYGMRVHPITGIYKLHDGTDFGVGCGTPIRAAASGTVLRTSYAGGYGNQTVIEHGVINGSYLATSYNHQSRFGVSQRPARRPWPGDRLRRDHRLLDRLPPALHGLPRWLDDEPDELAVDALIRLP